MSVIPAECELSVERGRSPAQTSLENPLSYREVNVRSGSGHLLIGNVCTRRWFAECNGSLRRESPISILGDGRLYDAR